MPGETKRAKWIKIYDHQLKQLRMLSDDQAGKIIKAVGCYLIEETQPELDQLCSFVFESFRENVDKCNADYSEKAKFGVYGTAARKKKQTQNNDNVTTTLQHRNDNVTTTLQNRIEKNRKDNNRTDNERMIEAVETADQSTVIHSNIVDSDFIESVVSLWNSSGGKNISSIKPATGRYSMLFSLVSNHGKESIFEAIENIKYSDFLQGKNTKKWIITFDWFLKEDNFSKVLAGQYTTYEAHESAADIPYDRSIPNFILQGGE